MRRQRKEKFSTIRNSKTNHLKATDFDSITHIISKLNITLLKISNMIFVAYE